MVVVLPVPLTPTMRITAGEWATSMRVSSWQKCSAVTSRSSLEQSGRSLMLAGVGLCFELLHDGDGGVHAHVGVDQGFLDLLPQVLVEAVEQDGGELLLQGLAALGEPVAQLAEPAPAPLLPLSGVETVRVASTPMNTSDQLYDTRTS